MDNDRTFTLRVNKQEFADFTTAVEVSNHDVSASAALRELMRWYAGGCGGRLELQVPVVYPTGVDAPQRPV
jgi:hypothetical protein